jgi:uncharacterized protein
MRLEHYSQKKLEKEILEIVGKYLDLKKYKVFFFGSRVNSKGDERSDIDIGIEGPRKMPDGIIYDIKEDIDNLPILYKIDVIDFKNTDKNFREVASQHKEYIN